MLTAVTFREKLSFRYFATQCCQAEICSLAGSTVATITAISSGLGLTVAALVSSSFAFTGTGFSFSRSGFAFGLLY